MNQKPNQNVIAVDFDDGTEIFHKAQVRIIL
jgi:hypothetical protein